MAGEQKLQTKIMKWLKENNYYSIKTIVCSKNGVMDIVGCTPEGRFFGIEVKFGANKASKLQEYNVKEVQVRGGIALVAWSLAEVELAMKQPWVCPNCATPVSAQ